MKSSTKKLVAIATSLAMTICMGGSAYAVAQHAEKAYAQTAMQTADGTIGVGIEATVTVSAKSSASFDLADVASGTYILKMIPSEYVEEATYAAEVDGSPVSITYNAYLGGYSATVSLTPDSTVTVTNGNAVEVQMTVSLSEIVLNAANYYMLDGLTFSAAQSAEIALQDVQDGDSYVLVVDPLTSAVDENATLTAVYNGVNYEMKRDENYFGAFTARLTIAEGARTIKLSTTNTAILNVSVSLVETVTVLPLPEHATLPLYEAVIYSYTVATPGYYSLWIAYSGEETFAGDVGAMLKTSPEAYEGVTIQGENFPLYLEKGEYFFELVYMGESTSAEVDLAVRAWVNQPINTDHAVDYIPITTAKSTPVTIALEMPAGTYSVVLFDIPMAMRIQGAKIFGYFGNSTPVEFNLDNGYTRNINLTGATTVYFTTDWDSNVTVGFEMDSRIENIIHVGEETSITLGAGESLLYLIQLPAGIYTITLTLPDGAAITVYFDGEFVLGSGAVTGILENEGEEGDITVDDLTFVNEGEEEVTFSVLVEAAE